jgi:hypothetical protein
MEVAILQGKISKNTNNHQGAGHPKGHPKLETLVTHSNFSNLSREGILLAQRAEKALPRWPQVADFP